MGKRYSALRVLKYAHATSPPSSYFQVQEVNFDGDGKPIGVSLYEGEGRIYWEDTESPADKVKEVLDALLMPTLDGDKLPHRF